MHFRPRVTSSAQMRDAAMVARPSLGGCSCMGAARAIAAGSARSFQEAVRAAQPPSPASSQRHPIRAPNHQFGFKANGRETGSCGGV
eukprot:4356047-Pleurochrysis_carterae.AAC.3